VLLRQLDYFFEHPKFTEGEKIGAPLFLKMNIQWICEAFYEDIPKELIVKVSPKCGATNKLDGSEDHLVNVKVNQVNSCPI